MTKKLFFLLTMLFYLTVQSQNILVRYYQPDFNPTTAGPHYSASPIERSSGGSMQEVQWGTDNVFYSAGGWPAGASPDAGKYIEVSVAPDAGYKLTMSAFSFDARMQGGSASMTVRYSTDATFANYKTLQAAVPVSAAYTRFQLAFPGGTQVYSGQRLFLRIYVYGTYNNFHLKHNLSGTEGPSLTGTVALEQPVKPTAMDDRAGTLKNTPVAVDVLSNDDYLYYGPLSAVTVVQQPENGTVKVSGSTGQLTYTPNPGYTGFDSFYYTLSNGAGSSGRARVSMQVVDGAGQGLVQWNRADYTSVNSVQGITGAPLTPAGIQLSLTNNASSSNGPAFTLSGLPNSQEFNGMADPAKYLQLAVNTDSESQAYLKSFKLSYRGGGTGNVSVKYSKKADFSDQIFTLIENEAYTDKWVNKDLVFPAGTLLFPGETLYIRIYAYNTYNKFFIDYKTGTSMGPRVEGFKSLIYTDGCAATVTWNGSAWNGGLPSIHTKAVIAGNYDTGIHGPFEACTLSVTDNAALTVAAETTVSVVNEIAVAEGSLLTVKNEANLIQVNDNALNTGNITVERKGNLKRLDYIYWASPVKGQQLKKFSPGTLDNRFYTYNEANDFFEVIDPKTNIFGNSAAGYESAAKGYAIRASNLYPAGTNSSPAPNQIFNGVFTGVPNNGVIQFPLKYKSQTGISTGNGYNLIGNPYPSNINFDQLVKDNESLIEGTAYFWTNVNPNPAMQGSNYPQGGVLNNYAVLGLSGSIPATFGRSDAKPKYPSKIIEVGQGFIIRAKKQGNLIFNNSYRTSETDGVFFSKGSIADKTESIDRYWLELTTPMEVVTTALVAYIDGASNALEEGYDARVLSLGSDALFSKAGDEYLGIQGRQYPLNVSDRVHLGTSHYQAGLHTLSISKKEGIFANGQPVYLKDRETGTLTDLNKNPYPFFAAAGLSTDRFEIMYETEGVLGADEVPGEDPVIYRAGAEYVIKSKSQKITALEVIDSAGRVVYRVIPNSTTAVISTASLQKGFYVVQITQPHGTVRKKIVF